MRRTAASRIAYDCVRAIVIVTVAMCSFGAHALVARSSIQPPSSPVPIAAGATHSIAVTPVGQVWTWGGNHLGQLGTGDTTSYALPVPVTSLSSEFIAVGAGLGHSLALDYQGRVWSWGLNLDGQLGDGSRMRRLMPVLVSQASDIVAIAAGSVHSLALRSDGRVLAWGGNLGAQLGDGTNTGRTLPVLIAGLTDVIAIAAGTAHSLALRSDGSVWAWGTNLTGQLGIGGSAVIKKTPTRVTALAGITAIAAGGGHSAAVSSTGAVWAWGWNAFGQVGDGTRTTRRTPVLLAGIGGAVAVSAGGVHTLATTSSGTMFAWGGNDLGQLGDGTTSDRLVPTAIASPANVVTVAAGAVHSLLLTGELTAWSWGNNLFGQLGDGSQVPSRVPIPVSGLESGVAPPTFSPAAGTYDQPIEVTISTPTPDATVYYTTNGDDPTESDAIASDPFATYPIWIDQTTLFKARAFKPGMAPSPVSQAEYVLNIVPPPDQPTFSHEGGQYSQALDVTITTTTPGAEIRYTLDESEPSETSQLYVGPLHIATRTMIRARAFLNGRGSDTSAVLFMFQFGRAATPTATPAGGMYEQPQSVTLSAQPGASIYYTLNGGTPSESSTLYESPISIAANLTLKARAFHVDYTQSLVMTADYIIDNTPTGLPPDPSTVAPPVDPTEQTDFAEATAFIYTGPNRLQRFVTPGAIVPERVTVLRGLVHDRTGAPISGVRITALNEPGLGYTLTREDGMFDLAVNGGGRVTIDYTAAGYLPLQRTVLTGWNDYVWAPDVVMTALDPNVTVIPMGSSEALAARGSAVTDADGTRQATLIVPEGGIVANIELPDGTQLSAVSQLSIRATEYTVGTDGRAAMPGELPNASGYTYAVELSADEAILANATRVTFDRPLPFYVENFLGFPVGGVVPSGYFDRTRAQWVAADNGRIVGIVSETNGAADLDLNGDAIADDAAALTALGVTDGERWRLAVLYNPGQSLWRVPIPHFTPWDHNWPYMPPEDAERPNAPSPQERDRVKDGCEVQHSIVECESQALGEQVGIAGTPFSLNYRSSRQPGAAGPSTVTVPLTGPSVPSSLKRIDLDVMIAGRRFLQSFPSPSAGATAAIAWDGKDAYGRTVFGGHAATVTLKHVYAAIYSQPSTLPRAFGNPGLLAAISTDRERGEFYFEQTNVINMRSAMSPRATVGGWSLDAHHVFDRIGNTIWLGDGGRRGMEPSAYEVKEWGANVPNTANLIGVLPDGGAVLGSPASGMTTIYPNGNGGFGISNIPSQCRGPSSDRALAIAVGAAGQVYYAQSNVQFGINGNTTTLCVGRRKPNNEAENFAVITLPTTQNLAVARLAIDDGDVLYASAGGYLYHMRPGGSPSLIYTSPTGITAIAATRDGDLYIATASFIGQIGQIRRRSQSGVMTLVAGVTTGNCDTSRLDGPLDPLAVMCPTALTTLADGSVVYADRDQAGAIVRRLWPDQSVTTIARAPQQVSGMQAGKNDEIIAVDGRLKRIVPAMDEPVGGPPVIVSSDGSERHEFSPSGRHLRTLDPTTGVTLFTFGYNPQGFLTAVTDRHGQITTIERDGSGAPQAIVGPFGHRTALQINADGYLTSIVDPAGGTTALDYRAGGLLSMFSNANNHASHFDYDDLGRLISDRDAAGGELTLTRTNLPTGWSVRTQNALGHQETYTVAETAPGRNLRTRTFPDGSTLTRQDLADGSEEVSPDGTRTRVVVAPDPRFGQQAAFPSSVTTRTPAGLVLSVSKARTVENVLFTNPPQPRRLGETTSINGRVTSTVFDLQTRTITTTSPVGRRKITTVDAFGRAVSVQVGNTLLPTTLTYDTRGRLATRHQGTRTTTFTYGVDGYLATMTDPLSRTVQLGSDAVGRITSHVFPDLREAAFAYDANGNLTSLTPPGRSAHTLTYTPADLLEQYTPPALGVPIVTQYQFNTAKQPTTVTRADGGQITWAYDTAGRPATLTTTAGATTYGYHPATGQLSTLTSPSGGLAFSYDGSLKTAEAASGFTSGSVSWNYDTSFRITSERVNGIDPIAFGYDADDLVTSAGAVTYTRRADDGLILGAALGSTATSFTFSNYGELASEETSFGGAPLYGAVYTRDNGGRLSQRDETFGAVTVSDVYGYDLAGRLTSVTRDGALLASYTYDANGNRTGVTAGGNTITAAYDGQDRILSFGDRTYTHNAHGEVRGWADAGGITTLSYDAHGNLLAVGLPSGTTVEYVVDARNRRIGRKLNGLVTHRWLYQGQLRPVAEVDAAGAAISRFVYGARAVAPEYMVRGGITYRFITDYMGSVRLVVDAGTGAIVQRLDYDAWGRVTTDTNPGFQPFGYAGGIYDSATTLVRFGVRDYDAHSGRWLSKDPIGFAGRQTNLYTYVSNNPVNLVDPTGLIITDLIDIYFLVLDIKEFVDCPGWGTGFNLLLSTIGGLPGVPSTGWIRHADEFGDLAKSARQNLIRESKRAGKAFEDEIADHMRKQGMKIDTQVPIETPFGTRVLDIVVYDDSGKIIGAVETKLNDSRYLPSQRAKDAWLGMNGIPVNVVRNR